jgi:3-deoxy-D-manno-oct-2-ulosonic acid (Kdo) hydroxylase
VSNLAATADSPDALEVNDLLQFSDCPFPFPPADQLEYLRRQEPAAFGHKDVSYDPETDRVTGLRISQPPDAERLTKILARFSATATTWLRNAFPAYAAGLSRDRVTLRTAEEATRNLRLTARNDLLHIDNFPTRPAHGRRILRLAINIHPSDPQVWATSERFPQLLARFAERHRIPTRSAVDWTATSQPVVRLFTGGRIGRSGYDAWMLRLHHYLKQDEAFQAQAARRVWTFPPGSMWALFADGVAHAHLRGRHVLEHSFFIPVEALFFPAHSPLQLLAATGNGEFTRRAG